MDNMDNNENFRLLKEAFGKLAGKLDGKDIAARLVRSAAAGGKAAVDRGLVEFPKTFINKAAKDVYTTITSQEVADGVSGIVRSFDEEKVKQMVDDGIAKLKDRETALSLAKKVKEILAKTSADDLEAQLDGMMGNMPLNQRMLFLAFFSQVKPVIEEMKNSSEEEVADKIQELADNIPSDLIAQQVAALTREVTPERVSKQAHDVVGALPSPGAVADIVHGLGKTASESLDSLSKIADTSQVGDIVREFTKNAGEVVDKTLTKDTKAKTTFKKKGQDFDL